jgi:hypothetical protein
LATWWQAGHSQKYWQASVGISSSKRAWQLGQVMVDRVMTLVLMVRC